MSSFKPIIYIKKNTEMLKAAKDIFGETLVKAAYDTYEDYGNTSIDSIQRELEKIQKRSCYSKGIQQLDIGRGDGVLIEFSNEKVVEFSTSEWGNIRSINIHETSSIDQLLVIKR